MKKIAVETLKEGSIFSAPVYMDTDRLFVAEGVPLEQKEIDYVRALGIGEVLTEGEIVGGPGVLPEKKEETGLVPPPDRQGDEGRAFISLEQEAASYAAVTSIIQQVNAIFVLIERRQFDANWHWRQISAIVTGLSGLIQANAMLAVSFVLNGNLAGYPLAKNAVQTAILAALVFRELSSGRVHHQDLLLGALFHDIGMLRLPKAVMEKKGKLSDLERELIQAHVVYGYQIVRQELRYNELVGDIVLQHHERWDGTGYIRQLSGDRITTEAKIISAADAFEAMVNKKPYRNSMTGYDAMKNLISDNSRHFDPAVLAAFVKIMGVYPVGQEVLLNDGRIARVIEARQQAPLRPLVVLTQKKDGIPARNEIQMDLFNQPSLYIVRAIQKQKD